LQGEFFSREKAQKRISHREHRARREKSKIEDENENEKLKNRGEIGFDWVCFPHICKVVHFHNPLLNRSLSSFWLFVNWVCIGFVLALIGFVLALFLLA
jgi:hypothetical protein